MADLGADCQSLTPKDGPRLLCTSPQEQAQLDQPRRKPGQLTETCSPLSSPHNQRTTEESSEVETFSLKERSSSTEMLDEPLQPPLRLLKLCQHPRPMVESSSSTPGHLEQANMNIAASKIHAAETSHQTNMQPRLLRKKHSRAGCRVPLLCMGRCSSQRAACALRLIQHRDQERGQKNLYRLPQPPQAPFIRLIRSPGSPSEALFRQHAGQGEHVLVVHDTALARDQGLQNSGMVPGSTRPAGAPARNDAKGAISARSLRPASAVLQAGGPPAYKQQQPVQHSQPQPRRQPNTQKGLSALPEVPFRSDASASPSAHPTGPHQHPVPAASKYQDAALADMQHAGMSHHPHGAQTGSTSTALQGGSQPPVSGPIAAHQHDSSSSQLLTQPGLGKLGRVPAAGSYAPAPGSAREAHSKGYTAERMWASGLTSTQDAPGRPRDAFFGKRGSPDPPDGQQELWDQAGREASPEGMQSTHSYSNAQSQTRAKDPEPSQQSQQAHRGGWDKIGSSHEPAGQSGREGLQGAVHLHSKPSQIAAAECRNAAYSVPIRPETPGDLKRAAPLHNRFTRTEHGLEPHLIAQASGTEQRKETLQQGRKQTGPASHARDAELRPAWSNEGLPHRGVHELKSSGIAMHPARSAALGRQTAVQPYVSPYAASSLAPLRLPRRTQQAFGRGHSTAGGTRRGTPLLSRDSGMLATQSQSDRMKTSGSSVSQDLASKALARAAVQPATRPRPVQTKAWAPDITQPFALDGLPDCSRSQKFIASSIIGSPELPAVTCGALEIGLVRASVKAAEEQRLQELMPFRPTQLRSKAGSLNQSRYSTLRASSETVDAEELANCRKAAAMLLARQGKAPPASRGWDAKPLATRRVSAARKRRFQAELKDIMEALDTVKTLSNTLATSAV